MLNNATELKKAVQDVQKDIQEMKKAFQQGQLIRQLLAELADIKNMSADALATQLCY